MGVLAAAPDPASLVRARAVAGADAVVPGQPLWVGVIYDIAPGWHIYWLNPGDSGLSTDLRLTAPGSVGPVQYPGPHRFSSGDEQTYGYAGQTALMAELRPDVALGSTPVSIGWQTGWLACRDICLRGTAEGTLTLPVAAAATPTGALVPFLAQIPVPLAAVGGQARLQRASTPSLLVQIPGATTGLLFPGEPGQARPPEHHLQPNSDGLTLTVSLTPEQAAQPGALVGVLDLGDGRWVEIRVP